MADPLDLDWFDAAKKTYDPTPLTTTEAKPSKSFGEATGEVLGGIGGSVLGVLGEAGRYVEEAPEAIGKLLTEPATTFRDFSREVELLRKGATPPVEPESGLARVFMGAVSQTGKQVKEPEKDKKGLVVKEAQYQSTPLYEAAKRDALNLGEGLLDLASTAVGFNSDALQKAQAQMVKEGRPLTGFGAGFERGGRAGYRAGEEFAGGMIGGGLIGGQALADLPLPFDLKEGSPEGKRLYREAPITTALSVLPIIKGLGNAATKGVLSAAQRARVSGILARIPNPATGKPFGSVLELTQHLEEIERKVKGGEQLTPEEQGLRQAEGARTIPIEAEALTGALEDVKKGALGVAEKATRIAPKVLERLPYVSAATSLGGPVAGAIAAGLAYGGPLYEAFLGGKKVPAKVPLVGGKKMPSLKTAKRAILERRTYETPEAETAGEAGLTAAGETRVVETKVGDLPERMGKAQLNYEEAPAPQTTAEIRADLESRLTFARQTADFAKNAGDTATQTLFENAALDIENAINDPKTYEPKTPIQLETTTGNEFVVGDEGVIDRGSPSSSRRLQINPEAPENANTYQQLVNQLRGTELDIYDPKTNKAIPTKEAQVKRLYTLIRGSTIAPNIMLLDPEVRAKTIEIIQRELGQELTDKGKTQLNDQLVKIGNDAFGEGTLTQTGVQEGQAGIPRLQIDNYKFAERALTEQEATALSQGQNIPLPKSFALNDAINEAARQSKRSPERIAFSNFLKQYNQSLQLRGGGGFAFETGGLMGKSGGFTQQLEQTLTTRGREGLPDLFRDYGNQLKDLVSVADKDRVIEFLDAELVEPRTTEPAYLDFIRSLREKVEGFKRTKVGGRFTYPSVAETPTERAFDITPEEVGTSAKLAGFWKRLATTYNPAVLVGNFLGNAFVESQATGKLPPQVLAEQTARAVAFTNRVAEAKKVGSLGLRDEVALRAIPADSINVIENFSNQATLIERGRLNPVAWATKGLSILYDWGDRLPKTAEAIKQSTSLIDRLEGAKASTTFALQTGPELFVYLTKNADGTYSVVNPRTGNILASGTLENAKIKRVLGSAVKAAVDTKFPDVRNLPTWQEAMARTKGPLALPMTAVVVQPFMSYVLKAADAPGKRGIFSNLMLMADDPVMFEFGGTGKKQPVGSVFNKLLSSTRFARNYVMSRGMVNSFLARYNELDKQDREALRQFFAFYPSQERSLFLGELMKMNNGEQVRRTGEPSFVNFWSMTDTYLRIIPAIVETTSRLTGVGQDKVREELASGNKEADYVLERYALGQVPDEKDLLKAVGVSGGMAKDLYYKMTDPTLGAKPLTISDYARVFGSAGQLLNFMLSEENPNKVVKEEIKRTGEKSAVVEFGSDFTSYLVGTAILNPKINDVKVRKLLEGSYNELWNNLIQPLKNDADRERKKGNLDRALQLEQMAERLNNNFQNKIEAMIEARIEALNKVGINSELRTRDYRKVFREVEASDDIMVEPEGEAETPQEEPKALRFERSEPEVPEPPRFRTGEE